MSIWYLYLDDLYGWWSTVETVEPRPPVKIDKSSLTESFIDELNDKLKERRNKRQKQY